MNNKISLFILSLLLIHLEEQQVIPENYDDVITAGFRHHATGLFLKFTCAGFYTIYMICILIIHTDSKKNVC